MYIYRGGYRGNIGQLNKNLTVRDIGQLIKRGDTNLISKKGESRSPNIGLSISTAPSYKTQLAYYKETLTGNIKQKLAVV